MKAEIDRQITSKVPGLAIVAVDADEVLFSEGFGIANFATGHQMTAATVCNGVGVEVKWTKSGGLVVDRTVHVLDQAVPQVADHMPDSRCAEQQISERS